VLLPKGVWVWGGGWGFCLVFGVCVGGCEGGVWGKKKKKGTKKFSAERLIKKEVAGEPGKGPDFIGEISSRCRGEEKGSKPGYGEKHPGGALTQRDSRIEKAVKGNENPKFRDEHAELEKKNKGRKKIITLFLDGTLLKGVTPFLYRKRTEKGAAGRNGYREAEKAWI